MQFKYICMDESLSNAFGWKEIHYCTDNHDVNFPLQDTIPHDTLGHGKQVQPHRRHGTPTKKPMAATAATAKTTNGQTEHQKPTVMKHFIQRPKTHPLAQVGVQILLGIIANLDGQ